MSSMFSVEQIQKLKDQFEFDRYYFDPERVRKTKKIYSLKIRVFCTVYFDQRLLLLLLMLPKYYFKLFTIFFEQLNKETNSNEF